MPAPAIAAAVGRAASGAARAAGTAGRGMAMASSGALQGATKLFATMNKSSFVNALKQTHKRWIDPFQKAAKNKSGNKELGKAVNAIGQAAQSMGLSLFIYYLEQMQVLTPVLKVWASLLKYLGGVMLMIWMPLIERWIAVATSPEFLAAWTAYGEFLAYTLYPILDLITQASEAIDWKAIEAFWGGLRDQVRAMQYACYGASLGVEMLTEEIGRLWNQVSDFWTKVGSLPSLGTQGRSGGGGGGGGGVISRALSSIGLQSGTPYVSYTGLRLLHTGESVFSAEDNTAMRTGIEEMALGQRALLHEIKTLNRNLSGF